MTGRLSLGAVLAAVLALGAAGMAAGSTSGNMHDASVITVHLSSQNGSGQSGTATLIQQGNDVLVTLVMTGIPHGVAEPAHIHAGTCANLNPAPKYPLTNATNGTTKTTIRGVRLPTIVDGHYAINVHDAANLARYVACGEIK